MKEGEEKSGEETEKCAAMEECTTEADDCTAETPLRQQDNVENKDGIEINKIPTTPLADGPRQFDVQFSNVYFSVPLKKGLWKEILHNVSGEFRAGRLTAILGPSGSGKTTLLSLIACRRNNCKINNPNANDRPETTTTRMSACYVPQEFELMPFLTTRETIYIASRLKLSPKDHDDASRNAIIQDVAEKLSLLGSMNTLACNLSGGEKKRLSIAVEMITSPSLLLLDEPTSGLDSASSNQVISLLSFMARQGCTVACVVHQPSSRMTQSFDDLMIMNQGRCAYCGPRDKVLDHFRASGYVCPDFYNLSEFLLEVVTGQRGGDYELTSGGKTSADRTESTAADDDKLSQVSSVRSWGEEIFMPERHYAVSSWEQHKVLLRRAFICISRDNTLTKMRLSAHLIVAVLLGLVFYDFGEDASKVQSNVAALFFFALFLFFANAMPAVQTFPSETRVFLRENANNWYSLESYYVTKVLSDLPLQIVCPTGFLLVAYYLTGQPLEAARFFQVWMICILTTILAQSFGIATGAAFSTHAGTFLVPAFNIPMFLFAGFFLKLGEIPFYLQFFSDVSYFRYAFEGLLQAVYLGRPKIPCYADFCYLRTPDRILGELGMPSMPLHATLIALVVWIVGLHSLVYGVLRYKLRAKVVR
ncbi:ATP-binding cassette sub-family G member 1-like [Copidosoma floridanum]|uniref:ATP-binding cassette sub-family G member 1-like n=1 Tax=Copidosoma floridanum TaxID=29053 RepID=UPI0006C99687|nr:ATP-binding cassette sub-family G member 1-like [Copidosoma floridanum]